MDRRPSIRIGIVLAGLAGALAVVSCDAAQEPVRVPDAPCFAVDRALPVHAGPRAADEHCPALDGYAPSSCCDCSLAVAGPERCRSATEALPDGCCECFTQDLPDPTGHCTPPGNVWATPGQIWCCPSVERPDAGGARDDGGAVHGWLPIASADGCLDFATAELLAVADFAITPCPDRPGCRRIVAPAPGPWDRHLLHLGHGGAHDGARGVFVVEQEDSTYRHAWVVDDRGRRLAGYRSPAASSASGVLCQMGDFDVSATQVAFALMPRVGPPGVRTPVQLYRSDLGAVPSEVGDLARTSGDTAAAALLLVDTGRVAAWMMSTSTDEIVAAEVDATISRLAAVGRVCGLDDVAGDAVLFHCGGTSNTDYVQVPGGTRQALFDPSTNDDAIDSDGRAMAWFRTREAPDGTTSLELWTSPHATRAADVHERRVAVLPATVSYHVLRVGFGHAVLVESALVIGVYRLWDGARAELRAPAGETWSTTLQYVGPTEIAVATQTAGSVEDASALMFLRYDAMTFVAP